jgi:hypothetical protein
MRYAAFALLLLACDPAPEALEASDEPAQVPLWRAQGCYATDAAMPMSGEASFCPAVHDYARGNDAGVLPGEALAACDLWVWCPDAFGGCFNCAEWSPYPGSL